ncbi:hypothetical protein GC173_01145 [bacterium]|nr:hypothetical protein [bacterium]
MKKPIIILIALIAIPALIVAGFMWSRGRGASDAAGMEMMTKPWKANVVLSVTVKDEAETPMRANAKLEYFKAVGSQGGYGGERFLIDGARRIELRGVSHLVLRLEAEDAENFEMIEKEWLLDDLNPAEWQVGRDGSTVMLQFDAVLKRFPHSQRPDLEDGLVELNGWAALEHKVDAGKHLLKTTELNSDLSDTPCDAAMLLSTYAAVDYPTTQVLYREPFYPDGYQIVLRVCSSDEEDGLLDSGVIASNYQFGNTTPEAPATGYQKQMLLPYEWFEREEVHIIFIRLGGIYGKICVFPNLSFPKARPILLSERPYVQGSLLYNPDGSRNLRTTYPD